MFGRRNGGYSGFSKSKAALDERIAKARKKAGNKKEMASWRIHDLRHFFVTYLHELKIAQPHVVEALVNHVSGHKGGVAGRTTQPSISMSAGKPWRPGVSTSHCWWPIMGRS